MLKPTYGWYICEECKSYVPEGYEQRDEENRLLCPVCFVKDAHEDEYDVPKPRFKARYK